MRIPTISKSGAMKYFPFIVLLALACPFFLCKGASAKQRNEEREKAKYYYLEGARWHSLDSISKAYEYYKKAWLTDPSYSEAASAYGMARLMNPLQSQNEQQIYESLAMIRQYVDSYPGDFYEASNYAFLAAQTDTVQEAIRVLERIYDIYPDRSAVLLSLGDLYKQHTDYPKSIRCYRNYERIEGRSVQTTLNITALYLSQADTVEAIAAVDSLIMDYPGNPSYIGLKGKIYSVINKPDSAFKYLTKAEQLAPQSGAGKMALAEYYLAKGDSINYDNKIYEALLAEDFELEQKTELMAEYLQRLISNKLNTERGDYLFRVYREQYPHEPTVLSLAARYSAAKGNFKEAVEEISRAIDLDKSDPDKPAMLMSYQISMKDYTGALNTFKLHYTTGLHADESVKLLYATAAMQANRHDLAHNILCDMLHAEVSDISPLDSLTDESLRRSLTYDQLTRTSVLLNLIGDNLYAQNRVDDAMQAYRNSIFFYPDNASALNNYAYFMAENGGNLEEAEQMSRKAIDRDPDNDTFLDTYAWILFLSGKPQEALTYQESAVEKAEADNTSSAELYQHLGQIQEALGNFPAAREAFEKGLELEPDNSIIKSKIKALPKK